MPPQSPDFTVPEAVAVPMLALDSGGVVRGANSAFSSGCGLRQERVIGQPLASLCDPSGRHEPALQALAQALRNGAPLDNLPLELRGAAAPWPVRVSLRPLGAASWLTVIDATHEREAE